MTNLLPFLMLLAFGLLSLIAPSPLYADDDAALTEPEGVITECEALWREEIPRYLDMEPNGMFSAGDGLQAADVAMAPDGSLYLLCNIAYQDRDATWIHALLVKYDSDGNRVWHRILDENTSDTGYGVEVDAEGNVYLVGTTSSIRRGGDHQVWGFVTSYNARGRHRWTYIENGRSGTVPTLYRDLTIHGDSVYAVGSSNGRVGPGARFDETHGDAMVTRIRLNGRKQWTRQYQGDSERWRIQGLGITATQDGGVFITGVQESLRDARDRNPAPADVDCFVRCLDIERGDTVWHELVEGGNPALAGMQILSMGIDIDADAAGNVYVVGQNSVDHRDIPEEARAVLGTYVSKISGQGEVLWSRCCPNRWTSSWAEFRARHISVDAEGRIWVPGGISYQSSSFAGVLEYNAEGDLMHTFRYRSSGYDRDHCYAIAFDASQYNLLMVGASKQLEGRGDAGPQPGPVREAKPPHYFVMRLPLLEDMTGNLEEEQE